MANVRVPFRFPPVVDLPAMLDPPRDAMLLSKVLCLAVHDDRTKLFRPTGKEWNYRDTAADCYPFYAWADREIATLLVDHQNSDRLWGVHKLEANTVRSVLIHTMLHTRNVIARPWRQGMQLGAAAVGEGVCIYVESDETYQGRLRFDIPRHRLQWDVAGALARKVPRVGKSDSCGSGGIAAASCRSERE